MKQIINWTPESDPFTKKGEIQVHAIIHDIMSKDSHSKFKSKQNRINILKRAEKTIGENISGNVLDVGCGNGYASIFLAQNRPIDVVHSMECNLPAIDSLVRNHFKQAEVDDEKYELILGSFNDIKMKKFYNYVISLGALHHSSNLLKTTSEIYSSLQCGGYLIAHEPYMSSFTPNDKYIKKDNTSKKVQGLVDWRESNRDDHFFRKCEWLTAFHHSGFNIVCFEEESRDDDIFNAIIVLQKPHEELVYIPHVW